MATISGSYTLTDYVMSKNLSSLNLTINGTNDWSINNGWCASNTGRSLATNTAVFTFKLNAVSKGLVIGFERITSIRNILHVDVRTIYPNIEYTVLINYKTKYYKVMADGKYINSAKLTGIYYSSGASGDTWSNKWVVSLGGSGRVKFDSLKYAVNLPDDTMMNYVEDELYKHDDAVYGMNNGNLVKLHDDWNGLSDTEKIALFRSTNREIASTIELSTLKSFKILNLNETCYNQEHSVTVVPKEQLILPRKLLYADSFEGIDKVELASKVSANAKCKLLVTTDLTTYQTYDFQNQQWKSIDHINMIEVENEGIDAAQIKNIPRAAWDMLTTGKSGIGFAYLLSMEDVADTCNIDKLELLVEMKGAWNKAVHGMDYKYGYGDNGHTITR